MLLGSNIDQILSNLYLGNIIAATCEEILEENGITDILTMGNDMEPQFPGRFQYKVCELHDIDTEDIHQFFHEGIDFIQQALDQGGTVLVHCAGGISRSSTMICAYLMKTNSWTFSQALEFVKTKRFVCPNYGFRKQLLKFEAEEGLSQEE
ncbi:unnamed protein product [Moneuplotes crassus]|uniref:protein-tyrosine-phosphatase n=1 Tax=Euplotes crassus TaxID=5936 RepID=A0AAD2D846_EUPCR|nr:unnamed protein product [Moneuplotes crassus]